MEISKGIYLTWCEELGGSDNRPVFSRNQTYYVFPYDIDRFLLDLSKLRKNHGESKNQLDRQKAKNDCRHGKG